MSKSYKIVLGASVGVTTLIGLFSVMPGVLAATSSSTKNAVVTVGASCSMNSTVSTAHTATIAQGNYNKGIGLTEVTTTCNDAGGYAIYAVGYGDDTLGNNVLHDATVGSTYDIATGNDFANATSSYSSNTSQWAMRVETVPGQTDSPTITNNFDSLSLVPTTYTKVAQYNANTSTPSTSSITTEYGAYIAIGQPAGTYTGKVKYTLVHPSSASPVVPPSPLSTCTTPVPGITYMQEITAQNKTSVMASLTTNTQYYLRDRRDETPYCVAKIETVDSSSNTQTALWMTQNLRITGTISATDSNFTGSDFNVSAHDSETENGSGGACYDSSTWDDSTALYNACSHLMNSQDVATINALEGTNYTVEQLGAVYNYAAATAGTIVGYYEDDYQKNMEEATEDICPAGWSMPYYNYNNGNGVDTARNIKFLDNSYIGVFMPVVGSSYYDNEYDAYWWSTTAGEWADSRWGISYYTRRNTESLNGDSGGPDRGSANFIRCVLK